MTNSPLTRQDTSYLMKLMDERKFNCLRRRLWNARTMRYDKHSPGTLKYAAYGCTLGICVQKHRKSFSSCENIELQCQTIVVKVRILSSLLWYSGKNGLSFPSILLQLLFVAQFSGHKLLWPQNFY